MADWVDRTVGLKVLVLEKMCFYGYVQQFEASVHEKWGFDGCETDIRTSIHGNGRFGR
jgi:hypothetical protein